MSWKKMEGGVLSDSNEIKNSLLDIKGLIEQYPNLALPIGVFIALLSLATIIKTLIDGFSWAHTEWGYVGVLFVVVSSVIILICGVYMANRALKPRPMIEHFQTPYLSKNPTLRWTYDEPKNKKVTYQVVAQKQDGTDVEPFPVPQGMYHRVLRDIQGVLRVKVEAMADRRVIRSSRWIDAEIYQNALQRIMLTGKLRVAVHEDPGEEIFCYYLDKWEGFDVDFAELIAEKLTAKLKLEKPIEVEYLFYPWPEVISSPNEYKVDMAIASISISDEREKSYKITFSEPYAESGLGVVASVSGFRRHMNAEINLDELVGKSVAVHNETTASELVEILKQDERYKDKITFHVAYDNDELRELLKNSTVDVVIYGYQRAFSMLEKGMFVQQLRHNDEIRPDRSGIAFAKINKKLRDLVNDIINENKEDLRNNLEQRLRQREKLAKDGATEI
jgi:ABC-type amino acid transport substrate-binding protein